MAFDALRPLLERNLSRFGGAVACGEFNDRFGVVLISLEPAQDISQLTVILHRDIAAMFTSHQTRDFAHRDAGAGGAGTS